MTNTHKIAALIFFSSLYFYSHVGTLYLQERRLLADWNLRAAFALIGLAIVLATLFLRVDRIGVALATTEKVATTEK